MLATVVRSCSAATTLCTSAGVNSLTSRYAGSALDAARQCGDEVSLEYDEHNNDRYHHY